MKPEPSNYKDKHAVSVLKDDVIVGYVRYNLASCLSQFLRREVNTAFAEVTGDKENRGAGYGLEIPCVYRLYGPKVYIDKMRESLKDLKRQWTCIATHIIM